ncbi:VCBS domain-containing protein [Microbulbifer sp. ZKSA004]|uniref:VCBS domain-containing protein n=1 Tax=Microbulbifer sp. ZKSA004 TaxID=3243389 RepID=UPI00403A190B
MVKNLRLASAFIICVLLASCGGGGSSGSEATGSDSASSSGSGSGGSGGSGSGGSGSGDSGGDGTGSDDSGSSYTIDGGSGSIKEDLEEEITGELKDVNGKDVTFDSGTFQGDYGEFSVDSSGHWIYAIDEELSNPIAGGQTAKDSFQVGIVGTDDTATVSISVLGFDDPYALNIKSPLATLYVEKVEFSSGNLTIDDVDGNTPNFTEEKVRGAYGDLEIFSNGYWEYSLTEASQSLEVGESVQDIVDIKLSDGASHPVVFEIKTVENTERSVVFIYMEFDDKSALETYSIPDLADLFFNNDDSISTIFSNNSLGQYEFIRHRVNDKSLDNYCYGNPGQEKSSLDCIVYQVPDKINGDALSYKELYEREHLGGEYTDGGLTFSKEAAAWAKATYVDENNEPLDLNKWDHLVYLFPESIFGLAVLGTASNGGNWTMVGLQNGSSEITKLTFMHEIGHNMRFGHSGVDRNNDGQVDVGANYSGTGEIMGNTWSQVFGSGHRDLLGWYDLFPEYTQTITPVAGMVQTVELQAIQLPLNELSKELPQQVKISSANNNHGNDNYYISYHIEHDIMNSSLWNVGHITISYLPNNDFSPVYTRVSTLKEFGDDFIDYNNGLKIKFEAKDISKNTATISITYND